MGKAPQRSCKETAASAASNATKRGNRNRAAARALAEAHRRGVARAAFLGPITVFCPPGCSESVLVRSDSETGNAAVDAYFAAKDAIFRRAGAVDMSDSDGEPDAADEPQLSDQEDKESSDSADSDECSDDDDDASSLADGEP